MQWKSYQSQLQLLLLLVRGVWIVNEKEWILLDYLSLVFFQNYILQNKEY